MGGVQSEHRRRNSKEIIQLGLNGSILRYFRDAKEASDITKNDRSSITKTARGKLSRTGQYRYLYFEDFLRVY